MKRTIFLNGRRRTLRALMFGAAVALLSVPVAQADPGYNFDSKDQGDAAYVRHFEGTSLGDSLASRNVQVIPYLSQGLLVGSGMAHDMDESVICNLSGCLPRNDVTVVPHASDGIVVATEQDAIDRLMAEPLSRLSGTGSVYFRADDFAPPRNVEVSAASAAGVDWSETAIWLAVGLAGALGLLGLGLVANRSRVRVAHS